MNHKYSILRKVLTALILCVSTLEVSGNLSNSSEDLFQPDNITESKRDTFPDAEHTSLIIVKKDRPLSAEKETVRRSNTFTTRGSSHIPKTYDIDTRKEVGEIPIISGTTKSGAKTYEVAIDIYPGMKGFQPALALSYNSQNGNSTVGKGWSLSGISSIRRTVKNLYYDGKSEGVRLNKDDAFILDGIRLIRIDTSNPSYILYESEYGNVKVKGYVTGDIQTYFEVFYPNGEKGIFGKKDSGSQEIEYPLFSMVDMDGNRIDYEYEHGDGQYRITTISYNGCSVGFSYTTRKASNLIFSGGKRIYDSWLLNKIEVRYGSTITGTYDLSYTYVSDTALLSAVSYSCEGKSYNPLRFLYGDDGTTTQGYEESSTELYEYYNPTSINQVKTARGRINYELCEDGFLVYPNKSPYWRNTRDGANYDWYKNLYGEDDKILVYADVTGEFDMPMPPLAAGKGFVDVLCANLDGRMEESVVRVNNYVANGKDIIEFSVYKMAFGSVLSKAYTRTYEWGTCHTDRDNNKSVYPKLFYTGDFNGDGRIEIMVMSTMNPFGNNTGESTCQIIDLESDISLYKGYFISYYYYFTGDHQKDERQALNNADRFFPIDYDGDGKTDICFINNDGINLYTFDTSGNKLTVRKIGTDNILKRTGLLNRNLYQTDLNGDGLVDLLVSPTLEGSSSDWFVYNSKGSGMFERKAFVGPVCTNRNNESFMFQDVDGDGILDMIRHDDNGFSTYMARENHYGSTPATTVLSQKTVLVPTNIHTSSKSTHLIGVKGGIATKYSYCDNNRSSTLLRGMVNSLGIVEINNYGELNTIDNHTDLYVKGHSSIFPYIDVLEHIYVVSSTETYHKGNVTNRHEYGYSEGVYHSQGLGFCGFKQIKKSNRKGHVEYQEFDPYRYSVLQSESGPGYEKSYTYDVSIQTNRLLKIVPVSKNEKDLLHSTWAETTFTCNSYGFPIKETVKYSDGTLTETSYIYNSQTEVKDGYNIGYNIGQEKKVTRNGSTYTEKIQIPAYKNRRPQVEILTKNGNTVQISEYTYDSHGNLTALSIKPYKSTTGQKTSYTYDRYGRIQTETDPLGLRRSRSYDASGRLSVLTDHRGNKTSFSYDIFGRETTVSYPDSTSKSISYAWNSSIDNSLYLVTESCVGQPMVKKYFDALNREVRSSETGVGGILRSTDTRYDEHGRIWKVSEPFTGNSATLWNVYEYDWYDRQSVLREASGRSTTYSYANKDNKVTISDEKGTEVRKYDQFDNLTSITDSSGTISYVIAPDGQLVSIEAPNGSKTTITYDACRRKSGLTDPSLGNITYTYDLAGNIATETNGNGNIVRNEYDSFNRLKKRTYKEFSTTYHYSSLGDIDSICSSNGTSHRYKYDCLGRLHEHTETGLDGIWLKKEYLYSEGNVNTLKYTSRSGVLATVRYFYSCGRLQEVKSGSTSILKVEEENEFGQPKEITTGPITRSYSYSNCGLPASRKVTGPAGVYQDLSYGFDNKSNTLTWRRDNTRGLKETFEYDGLNRLIKHGGNTVTYDGSGNICAKSDIGSFKYTLSAKPYAISEANLSSESISLLSQDVSYCSFSRPLSITEGEDTLYFEYNGDLDRVKMTHTSKGGVDSKHHYLGGCYEVIQRKTIQYTERLYLLGDFYNSPAVIQKLSSSLVWTDPTPINPDPGIGTIHGPADHQSDKASEAQSERLGGIANYTNLYYIIRDYLGSITHVVHSDGRLIQELSYDAWGRLRDPANLSPFAPGEEPVPFLDRGFTGHEHLFECGLINMNARLYDPALGRFLSPDPFVQMPDWSQNLNRYSYAMNNPLLYIDEDGQFFWFAVGGAALVGGVFNVLNNWNAITAAGGWNSVWQGTKYFMVGAAAGGVSAAVGIGAAVGFGSMLGVTATGLAAASSSLTTSLVMKTAEGAVNGFLLGSMNALIGGQNWSSALKTGAQDAVVDGVFSAATVGFQAITPKSRKTYSVYYGYDDKERIRYVGITSRDPKIRFAEHKRSKNLDGTPTDRSTLHFVTVKDMDLLTRREARIWEQNKINIYGLKKNGGELFNKRNEISRVLWDYYGVKY